MRIPRKALAVAVLAAVALLALGLLGVSRQEWGTVLGAVAGLSVVVLLVMLRRAAAAEARSVKNVLNQLAEIERRVGLLAAAVRDEPAPAPAPAPPRMLDGSLERRLAETAGQFDWIARRQAEQSDLLIRLERRVQELSAQREAAPSPEQSGSEERARP